MHKHQRKVSKSLFIFAPSFLIICGGCVDGVEVGERGPRPGEPVVVSTSLPSLATNNRCVQLRPNETVRGTNAEGYLWLSRTSSLGTTLRVLDAWQVEIEKQYSTSFTEVVALQAQSSTVASVIADNSLWSFSDGNRFSLSSPFVPSLNPSLCGALGTNAFVLDSGRLYQTRLQGQIAEWVQWQGLEPILNPNSRIISRDGSCLGSGDELLFSTGQNLWMFTPQGATELTSEGEGTHTSFLSGDVLMLQEGMLYGAANASLGQHERRWAFDHGDTRALSAGGRYAWLVADTTLLRFDGEDFAQTNFTVSSSSTPQLFAFASGGVWVVHEGNICSILPPLTLRISGLQTGHISLDQRLRFRARANDPGANITAMVADRPAFPIRVNNGWFEFDENLPFGWSPVELSASSSALPDIQIERTLEVRRDGLLTIRSWATDIQPIYQTHCSDSACHIAESASGAPDLSTYQSWVDRADAIRRRVLDQDNMPPAAVRLPSWGPATTMVIDEWLSGGQQP